MRRISFTLLLGCALPLIGQAQQHATASMPAMSGVHFSVVPAPMAAAHVAPMRSVISARPVAHNGQVSTRLGVVPKKVHPAGWNRPTRNNAFSSDPVFPNGGLTTDGYPVPGLGFDYPHYFATHPNAGRFPSGSGFVIPFIDGGFYIPVPMYVEGAAPAEQAAESDTTDQQPQPAEEPPARDNDTNTRRRARTEAAPTQQSEYVFVRRDGTLIFAVGYSWINDRLQYITEEGLRRTAPLNTLDLDATQQFNEQRGVPIQLPA